MAHGVGPGMPPGKDGIRALLRAWRRGFPDWQDTIEDIVAQHDLVVLRTAASGTHLGPIAGIAPTGEHVSWNMIEIVHVRDGRIRSSGVSPTSPRCSTTSARFRLVLSVTGDAQNHRERRGSCDQRVRGNRLGAHTGPRCPRATRGRGWCATCRARDGAARHGLWKRSSLTAGFGGTGGAADSSGRSVMPTPATTICRSVSRLVARKPVRSSAPARRHTLRACSRRQWPSWRSSTCSPSRMSTSTLPAPACEAVVGGHHEHEALLEEHVLVQVRLVDGFREHAHVEAPVAELVEHHGGLVLDEQQLEARVALVHRRHHVGQQVRPERGEEPDADAARLGVGGLLSRS